MKDFPENLNEVFLNPGEVHFGGGNTRISTLLGSCVSIPLWHPRLRIGGMCHYMLARRARPASAPLDGRYADEAFAILLGHVSVAGTRPIEYQAKLFGGANMLSDLVTDSVDIGRNNVAQGESLLASCQIALLAEHVGGSSQRKLHFDLWSGDVWLASPQGSDERIRKFKA